MYIGLDKSNKEVRQAQTHGFVNAHAADVRVDTKALADGITAPDEANVAAGLGLAAQMTEPRLAGDTALGILKLYAVENRLPGGQPGEFDPGGKVGAGVDQRGDESSRVGEQATGVPFHHHPRLAVAAAPDDRPVALQVARLHAIGELWTILDRRDHGRRQARHQQTGADHLHDTAATGIEIAHGVLPGKRKT